MSNPVRETRETEGRIESFRWERTSLGPRSQWPHTLRVLVETLSKAPVGMVLLWGRDATMISNDAVMPFEGRDEPDSLGRSAWDVWPDTLACKRAVLESGLQGQALTFRDQSLELHRDDGRDIVRFDLFSTPVRDDEGAFAGALCTIVEATGRGASAERAVESERRLAASEALLSVLVNQASIGIAQSDLDGRLVTVNDRFCSIAARSAEDLIGCSVGMLTHPDDRESNRALLANLLLTGTAFKSETRMMRPDGTAVWISNHVSLTRNRDNEAESVIRIVQDISHRKDAESRARDSSERIELALGAGTILGNWDWDIQGDRVTGDARFARSFSIDPDVARFGVPLANAIAAIHPDDRAYTQAAIATCLQDGGTYRAEYRLLRPDGSYQWVEANGHCERDPDGVPVRFPGVLINIGHRRNAAERQAFLIALGDQLRTIETPESVVVKTAEATARHLQAKIAGYGEASPDGRWIDLLACWSEGGPMALGRIPTNAFGREADQALHNGEGSLAAASPFKGSDAPHVEELGPFLAVPLFRQGRWHAVMFAAGIPGRNWSDAEADLLREVIGRTWEAVERARAVATLRKAQSRQAFLLRLNDHLSEIHDPAEVVETVAESLGRFLGVTRAAYGEVLLDEKTIAIVRDWTDGTVPNSPGRFGFGGLLDDDVDQMVRGLTVSIDDFSQHGTLTAALSEALERTRTRAALAVPLIRDGQLQAGVFLSHAEPRHWSLEEISLTQEVARRTWDALERTRAEQALQRSESNLRAMFDTLPVGILFAEMPSGKVTETNTRVEQIMGYSHDLASTEAAYDDWVAFDEDGRQVAIEEHPLFVAVTTGETATRVFHHQRGDGTRVWISVIGAPVRDPDRRITGGLVTIVDVDREKRAEAALRELNATLEQQVELRTRERDRVWRNSRDLLAVMGLDGVLHAVNPSWTSLLGWSADQLVGHHFEEFVHPADVAPTFAVIESMRKGELVNAFENRYRRQNGAYRWFSWTSSMEGETVYANGRDITAEKEQAQALRQAEEQLRQSQKMEAVGQLTGGIAHDFNNLLTGITGALDLLSKRIEQGRLENTSRYIDMAMTSANRAASLTHRLLAFSRRQPLEAKAVDVNRLVTSMDDLLRRTLGEKITLDVAVARNLWPTLCDSHQLENALLNLVINARDAMPDGGQLTIETANTSFDTMMAAQEAGVKPGSYVMLAVSDTGTGMSPDVIARAFDPFFTTKPIGQGTGLGLSMIYGFAKQSEGTVKIQSEADLGTTVKLYLPRFSGEYEEAKEIRAEAPRAQDGETVLIVEDDATVRKLVLEVLRDLGYRALEAEDGPAGLKVLDSPEHIDLLVTDVGLPGLNGRQLADRGRQLRRDLKVLFITGYAENASFGSGHLDPGMQMITKPFAVDALATRIREMIAGR